MVCILGEHERDAHGEWMISISYSWNLEPGDSSDLALGRLKPCLLNPPYIVGSDASPLNNDRKQH